MIILQIYKAMQKTNSYSGWESSYYLNLTHMQSSVNNYIIKRLWQIKPKNKYHKILTSCYHLVIMKNNILITIPPSSSLAIFLVSCSNQTSNFLLNKFGRSLLPWILSMRNNIMTIKVQALALKRFLS